jgi:hypothetical protein
MKNTYFKDLIQAEMARLESIRLQQERHSTVAVSSYPYTNRFQRSILKPRTRSSWSFFGFIHALRFISL